jgi:hypothetical protein
MLTNSKLQTIIWTADISRAEHENGILKISGGDQVAWFRDPDGNLLSVVEYAILDEGPHSAAHEAAAVVADASEQEPL